MSTRIAVARLWHEGNSFTPVLTRLADFERREWRKGEDVAKFYAGSRTEIGAAVDFFAANRSLTPIYLRCAAAGPSGAVEEADLQAIIAEIVEGVRSSRCDALYLSLHGALIGSHTLLADLALLKAAHTALGARPLAVSFDLHANLDPAIAQLADIVIGYKTHPHVDLYETGWKALELLKRELQGEINPVVAIAKAGVILPSFNMRTTEGPMAEIEALAANHATGSILDVTPFGGFAYGDSPAAGASVAVTVDGDRETAAVLARGLAKEMHRRRARFAVRLPTPAQAFANLVRTEKPAAILEPSDNPLSGGVGDSTGLLRTLMEHGSNLRAVFAFFWDPELVARCDPGARMRVELGGRLSATWGPPVPLDVEVERVTDGWFRNAGPMERGLDVNLGRSAVLKAGNLRVIVTAACLGPNDPQYFRLHGIDLAALDVVCAKAKNHFRAAFGASFDPIVEVDTPGPAAADLAALPFRNLPPGLL
ncbi:MAG: M81 family metallopeptidase [Betaproteobacteria bacterium]|nr:MAG: M81 family metallopeptidase [Betaproteobacteria bacterium]